MSDSDPASWMVVFDVDDTLYLERDYVRSGFSALDQIVRDVHGVDGFGAIAWKCFLNGSRGNIFDVALAQLGLDLQPKQIADLVKAYRSHVPQISILPDAKQTLMDLRQRGVGIGVLTDGPAPSQLAKVEALRLPLLADIIIVTDLYGPGYGKPHIRGFKEIEDRSGCDRFIYAADNPTKDFAGPKELGWSTIRVRRNGGLHEAVPHGSDVDDVISAFDANGLLITLRGLVSRA